MHGLSFTKGGGQSNHLVVLIVNDYSNKKYVIDNLQVGHATTLELPRGTLNTFPWTAREPPDSQVCSGFAIKRT